MNTEGHWFGLLRLLWILIAGWTYAEISHCDSYGLCILSQIKS